MIGSSSDYGSALFPQHAGLLAASAIAADVAHARGYRSVDTRAQLTRCGWGKTTKVPVPGLLIPIHGTDGTVRLHQYRPDSPRLFDGKPRKYETPYKAKLALDVHPTVRGQLDDADVPLWVTEGSRKVDAAVTVGLCCIGVLGVDGWTRDQQALPDWRDVALKDRTVYVAYDSDAMIKDSVQGALRRLTNWLNYRGASVRHVYLPHDGDAKTGLDDFLAAGHTVDDLFELVRDPSDRTDAEPDTPRPPPKFTGTLGLHLNDVHAFLGRYVVFADEHQRTAITLWVAHTWVHREFDATPRLRVSSPEAESGKTRLLEVLDAFAHEPLRASSTSPSALFRGVEELHPTVMLDEADNFLKAADKGDRADIIGIINDGYRADGGVLRVVGEGKTMKVQRFTVYAPLVLAGLSRTRLPDTTVTRSIPIDMRRKTAGETVERFRFRDGRAAAEPIRTRLHSWSAAPEAKTLGEARPELPDELTDRQQDIWEPLLAIADAAGGDWPTAARKAAIHLHTRSLSATRGTDRSLGVLLLNDIRRVWPDNKSKIATGDLLTLLHGVPESPWSTIGKDDWE